MLPRVVVLMATYNGLPWIDEQVDSILAQQGVDVHLRISDDGSTDGTLERLRERASADPRIEVLAPRRGPAGVTANFLHLFTTWAPTSDVCVAFSDQDDVWHPDKLRRQVSLLDRKHVDAVSSNVVSFDERGRRRLVVKSQPQVRWDHVFEAAGPGSTYLFSPDLHRRLLVALTSVDHSRIGVHDWFLYALSRGMGARWFIDRSPTVDYRQHGSNVQGENAGLTALGVRLRHLRSGFYREQFELTANAALTVGRGIVSDDDVRDLGDLLCDLEETSLRARWRVARRWREIRRNHREGLELGIGCLVGIW